jgi:hypothetical protein
MDVLHVDKAIRVRGVVIAHLSLVCAGGLELSGDDAKYTYPDLGLEVLDEEEALERAGGENVHVGLEPRSRRQEQRASLEQVIMRAMARDRSSSPRGSVEKPFLIREVTLH